MAILLYITPLPEGKKGGWYAAFLRFTCFCQ